MFQRVSDHLKKRKKTCRSSKQQASKYAPKSDLFPSVAKTWLNVDRFPLTMSKNSQSEESGLAASAVTC